MTTPRLSPTERVVLELLREHSELYGLDLVKKSDGKLKRGTVYVTLGRMADKGFVDSRQVAAPPTAGGLPRRLFKMTGLGERMLAAADWVALAFPEGAPG
ncbi:MAG: PadR family transcriptional regulator [Deltaproteobacteria bacterium]|nr:PadR family transcriptional regulator [Deltaproteobacteria bacterium]